MRKSQSRPKARGLASCLIGAILILTSCHPKTHQWTAVSAFNNDVEDTESSPRLDTIIAPYKESLETQMAAIIGTIEEPMTREVVESSLGNWMADVTYDYATQVLGEDIDLSTTNKGGIRIPFISSGPLTVGKIYELMPFDNMLVVLKMDYITLSKLLQTAMDQGGWPVSRGWEIHLKDGKITEVRFEGKKIDRDKEYSVLLTDYVADGGSDCSFLKRLDQKNMGILYRDALIEGGKLQQRREGKISSQIDPRVLIQ